MDFDVSVLVIMLVAVFIAAIVDAIAGGGGIITMSAFMLCGVPMHYAIGTNKTQALFGLITANFNYIRKGLFDLKFIPFALVGILLGSGGGSLLALTLTDEVLKIIMTVALPIIAAFILSGRKPKNSIAKSSKLNIAIATFILGISVGFYDGAIGPGSGTLMIIGFTICGLDILKANGNAKIIGLVSTGITATLFLVQGQFLLWLLIPCIIASMIGNYIGSKLAIKNGNKIVRPIMIGVLCLLFIKTFYELLFT